MEHSIFCQLDLGLLSCSTVLVLSIYKIMSPDNDSESNLNLTYCLMSSEPAVSGAGCSESRAASTRNCQLYLNPEVNFFGLKLLKS